MSDLTESYLLRIAEALERFDPAPDRLEPGVDAMM